jgi:hypothetical protein
VQRHRTSLTSIAPLFHPEIGKSKNKFEGHDRRDKQDRHDASASRKVNRKALALRVSDTFFMEYFDAQVTIPAVLAMVKSFGAAPVDLFTRISAYMLALGLFNALSIAVHSSLRSAAVVADASSSNREPGLDIPHCASSDWADAHPYPP